MKFENTGVRSPNDEETANIIIQNICKFTDHYLNNQITLDQYLTKIYNCVAGLKVIYPVEKRP